MSHLNARLDTRLLSKLDQDRPTAAYENLRQLRCSRRLNHLPASLCLAFCKQIPENSGHSLGLGRLAKASQMDPFEPSQFGFPDAQCDRQLCSELRKDVNETSRIENFLNAIRREALMLPPSKMTRCAGPFRPKTAIAAIPETNRATGVGAWF